jgi:hypothetical protein
MRALYVNEDGESNRCGAMSTGEERAVVSTQIRGGAKDVGLNAEDPASPYEMGSTPRPGPLEPGG